MISITDGQIYLQPDFNAGHAQLSTLVSLSRWWFGPDQRHEESRGYAAFDLAAFRELEAAQLGTELDPATQKQLDRGMRMVELLKQRQGAPLEVADQVLMIKGAGQGMMDDIAVDQVSAPKAVSASCTNNTRILSKKSTPRKFLVTTVSEIQRSDQTLPRSTLARVLVIVGFFERATKVAHANARNC